MFVLTYDNPVYHVLRNSVSSTRQANPSYPIDRPKQIICQKEVNAHGVRVFVPCLRIRATEHRRRNDLARDACLVTVSLILPCVKRLKIGWKSPRNPCPAPRNAVKTAVRSRPNRPSARLAGTHRPKDASGALLTQLRRRRRRFQNGCRRE
jgi:hypothetical protein